METEMCVLLRLLRLKIPITVIVFKQTPIKVLSIQNRLRPLWFLNFKEHAPGKVSVKCDSIMVGEAPQKDCRPPKIVALHELTILYLKKTEILFLFILQKVRGQIKTLSD